MGEHADGERDTDAGVYEYVGIDPFEHNQWTVEGEIERMGAFARGSHSIHGWRRALAVFIALVFILPFAIGILGFVVAVLRHLTGW